MRSFCVTHREFNGELCDNPEGWDGVRRGRLQKEGTYVYLRLIHIVVWQKPTQYCKAIILQLNNKFFQKKKKCVMEARETDSESQRRNPITCPKYMEW